MEFLCSNCGHIGPAGEVRPTDDGVEVVCSECGNAEPLSAGGPETDNDWEPPSSESGEGPATAGEGIAGFDLDAGGFSVNEGEERDVGDLGSDEAIERLVPETGEGRRCPKCARLIPEYGRNCTRCGLSLAEAGSYAPGEAPWERPPPDKEDAQRHAANLWDEVEAEGSAENLERFVSYVRDEALFEFGIRRLRFYLVDHPEDERAVQALAELAGGMESRLVAARVRAETDAEEFQEDISRIKRFLGFVVAALWIIAAIIVIQIFAGGGC